MKIQAKDKILLITRTAVFIALLVILQVVTKPLGQIVTGSCVNLVLAVAVLTTGFISGTCVALVSPFIAFLVGIGPAFFPITPIIAIGNFAFITVIYLISRKFLGGKLSMSVIFSYIGVIVGAGVKCGVLYLGVVKIFIPLMGEALKAPQITTFTAMFSLPQLFTALIGGAVAVPVALMLNKILAKSNS